MLVKGAVERMLELCDRQMDADGATRISTGSALRLPTRLAGQGLRVLAPLRADRRSDGTDPRSARRSCRRALTFTGLQAMLDPPRDAAAAAVAACHSAGHRGQDDHRRPRRHRDRHRRARSACSASREPGRGTVLTGADLAALTPDEIPDAVDRASVFARVSPEQKLRLVEALQARGHVVAMTGDGVNDAPALRQAGIGVAMGRGGTEVAKDAADMVLTDDDFATIEAAVEEGRGVFDNLTKFITWTLPTNIGEGLVILAAIVVGAALPILPTQILWINMTTAVALGPDAGLRAQGGRDHDPAAARPRPAAADPAPWWCGSCWSPRCWSPGPGGSSSGSRPPARAWPRRGQRRSTCSSWSRRSTCSAADR